MVIQMLPVGNPAVGKDFINREDEITGILNSLQKDNVLLIAPRRYGKTSIMKKIEKILKEKNENLPVIFIDIHDVYTPQEFLIELTTGAFDMAKDKRTFLKSLKSSLSGVLKDLEELELSLGELKIKFKRSLKKEITDDWKEEGRTLFEFTRNFFDGFVYFIIDEFSECIHNMSEKNRKDAEIFLKWFRTVRMKENNLKFIMGGSVSVDRVVRQATALSAINDFNRVTIDGFDKETAFRAVKKVFNEESWEYANEIGEKIIECIGIPCVPYFLSVFLSVIKEESLGKDLTGEYIEEIYNSNLMGAHGKHYFDYYVQRLQIYYDEIEEKAAKAILKSLCQSGEVKTEIAFNIFYKETNSNNHESFADLISDLENDFYLKQTADKIFFYSKPLRDWWRLYHA
jgi:AAA+ ATPase superfamily predicted ATPase